MNKVMLEMQGIRVAMASNNEDLIQYVPLHLPDHIVPRTTEAAANIEVNVRWFEGEPPKDSDWRFPGQEDMDRIGKRLLADQNSLVWTDTLRVKNLMLRFELDGDRLMIDALYYYNPRRKKMEEQPDYRYKKFFGLMSWFVYHPVSWYLEHFRGLYLLHASGISINSSGIVIGGVGGVGKTTTGVSLLANGGQLVSENLIFHDAENIYSCYEPIRLDDNSVEILGHRRDILRRADIPEGSNHKNLYQVDRAKAVIEKAEASVLFLPRFTRESFLRTISPEEAMERLIAFNELTREVNDYYWFSGTLNVLWANAGSMQQKAETLSAFLEKMGRYEIGIDRSEGVERVTKRILDQTMARAA